MINTNIKALSKQRVLRRLLLFKIQKEWKDIYAELQTLRIRKQLVKYQNTIPTISQIIHMESSVHDIFTKRINEAQHKALEEIYQDNELKSQKSQHTIKESWLREFMGKQKQRSKNSNSTFQETICVYIGFKNYAEFEWLYDVYLKMYSVHEALNIFAALSSNRGKEQWKKLIEEYNKQIEEKIPKKLHGRFTVDIEKAKTEISDDLLLQNKPIQQWTISELIQVAIKYKEKLSWFYHVIILEAQEYEITEKSEINFAYRNNLFTLVSVALLLIIASGATYFFTQPPKPSPPKPPFSHIYTPAELAQIQFKILEKDIGINQASFVIYYDFGKLPKPDTIEIAGTDFIDIESNPRYLTKVRDTVRVLFYKPTNYIDLVIHKPTMQTLKRILMPVPSSGWIAWASGNNPKTLQGHWFSSYRPTCEIVKDGILHFPEELLSKDEAAYYHSNIVNHQDFGIKGEACSVEVRLKNPPKSGEGTCMGYGFRLEGEENPIHFGAIPAGCSHWLGNRVGETIGSNSNTYVTYEQGKPIQHLPFSGDFSGLVPPISITNDWHTWKVRTSQGKVYCYLNGKLVYQMKYQGKIGRILSVSINFKGSGWVDWVRLRNEKEEEVYFEDFESCE